MNTKLKVVSALFFSSAFLIYFCVALSCFNYFLKPANHMTNVINNTDDSRESFIKSVSPDNTNWYRFNGNFDGAGIALADEIDFNPQDGCIYGNLLFLLSSSSVCSVYNLASGNRLCVARFPDYNGFYPHSNSVCLGSKISEYDPTPLIYSNVYNGYPQNKEMNGTCFVYRSIFDKINEVFSFEMVQVIKVGFTDDESLWGSQTNNKSPYGNFLVNGDELWVYLNIFDLSITRFFKFKLPEVKESNSNIEYVTLQSSDIIDSFDTFLFNHIQGGAVFNNYIFSLEGYGNDSAPSFLRAISLETKEVFSLDLGLFLGMYEPEFIDFYNGLLVIGTFEKHLFYIYM